MNAKEQYDVVRELREKVLRYDPHAVIAGGAAIVTGKQIGRAHV